MPVLHSYYFDARHEGGSLATHFGLTGIGIEEATPTWPSDSLFAALIAQAALLGEAGASFIAAMTKDTPPLRHSSLFPRVGDLVLLPRPALPLNVGNEKQRTKIGKGFKKVRWLSPALFGAVCCGNDLSEIDFVTLQGEEVWIAATDFPQLPAAWQQQRGREQADQYRARLAASRIWKVEAEPHVTVDRGSNSSAYYEAGRVFFAPYCGLALLTDRRDPAFERMLGLLGDAGIGGRRSVGSGSYVLRDGKTLEFDDGGTRVVTLSRFLPKREEIATVQHPASRYQLVEVGGWATTPESASFRRKEVTMLAEGAVLANDVRGRVVDVKSETFEGKPAHQVYRSGLALTLPVSAPVEREAVHAAR